MTEPVSGVHPIYIMVTLAHPPSWTGSTGAIGGFFQATNWCRPGSWNVGIGRRREVIFLSVFILRIKAKGPLLNGYFSLLLLT